MSRIGLLTPRCLGWDHGGQTLSACHLHPMRLSRLDFAERETRESQGQGCVSPSTNSSSAVLAMAAWKLTPTIGGGERCSWGPGRGAGGAGPPAGAGAGGSAAAGY